MPVGGPRVDAIVISATRCLAIHVVFLRDLTLKENYAEGDWLGRANRGVLKRSSGVTKA